eukprot:3079808-Prymnesium_polylepis.2
MTEWECEAHEGLRSEAIVAARAALRREAKLAIRDSEPAHAEEAANRQPPIAQPPAIFSVSASRRWNHACGPSLALDST